MARPHKQTVDYFPHDTDASEGKTMTIIQSKYGNDGYAFWFKLLQLLGKTSGHYYNFNNPADWEFLLAKTHQNDTETAKSILNTLALLDAIDAELFKNGVIWCQNFVDGVSDAYSRTVEGMPKRPEFLVNVDDKGISVYSNDDKATEIPQTKRILKDRILKEKYGEFKNVLLSQEEHDKLKSKFNNNLESMIEELSTGIESKGYKYKSHYATILSWKRLNEKRDKQNGQHKQNSGRLPKAGEYPEPEDL